jgi:hypothetical protein
VLSFLDLSFLDLVLLGSIEICVFRNLFSILFGLHVSSQQLLELLSLSLAKIIVVFLEEKAIFSTSHGPRVVQ